MGVKGEEKEKRKKERDTETDTEPHRTTLHHTTLNTNLPFLPPSVVFFLLPIFSPGGAQNTRQSVVDCAESSDGTWCVREPVGEVPPLGYDRMQQV